MFRLLGLLGGLSVATDLGTGASVDESLKRCLVATRLARAAGCGEPEVSDVVYVSLLQHLGCTAFAHEAAAIWGDDITSTHLALRTDFTQQADIWRTWVTGLAHATGRSRAAVLATTLRSGRAVDAVAPVATCEVARDASRRLGLPESVQHSLFHAIAAWDGSGYPPASGEAIPLPARITHVASVAMMFWHSADSGASIGATMHRSGRQLDPELCDLLVTHVAELVDGIDDVDAYEEVLAAEPDPVRLVDEPAVEAVARTFGDLAELKSPWLQGHSAGVAQLASRAAHDLGLSDDVPHVGLAGHLHDVGRVAVSSRIWDKPGPLSRSESDQVRLHAYHSEQVLSRVPVLAKVAQLAGQHHERCDGTGYHRGVSGGRVTMASRALAAADVFHALQEDRPHRPAFAAADAAKVVGDHTRTGALDGDAVRAVLRASGEGASVPRGRPADLTERQVQVLRLLARGMSNRGIGERLGISSRTAEHHVQDVYLKIGSSTRAGAALFAMEHGLLEATESPG